jgi:hypothetical protein
MKRFFVVLGIVLLLVSCDNGTMSEEVNPFLGTWENEHGRFVFTNTKVESFGLPNPIFNSLTEETLWYSGTYTYDNENIFITTDYRIQQLIENGLPLPLVYPYTIENNTMTIIALYKKVSK